MKIKLWIAVLVLLTTGVPETSFALGLTVGKFSASTLTHPDNSTLSISWVSRQFQQITHLGNSLTQDQLLVLLVALVGPALQLCMVYVVLINQLIRRTRTFIHRHTYRLNKLWLRHKIQTA